ncbi:hypothetical protein CCP3SC15_750014 [Gammaproteobacteria bacterium]
MKRIQRVLKDIKELHDFYKKTESLRSRIKENELARSKVKQSQSLERNEPIQIKGPDAIGAGGME